MGSSYLTQYTKISPDAEIIQKLFTPWETFGCHTNSLIIPWELMSHVIESSYAHLRASSRFAPVVCAVTAPLQQIISMIRHKGRQKFSRGSGTEKGLLPFFGTTAIQYSQSVHIQVLLMLHAFVLHKRVGV